MEKQKSNLIIKDPLLNQVVILASDKKFIEFREFQRLRNIKQLSFVDFVYPGANHTRFSHSIGAYHLMKKVLKNSLMDIDSKTKKNLRLAALLHDIGHGPFSHTWEKIFPTFDHEKTTREILRKYNLGDVADILDKKSEYSSLITSSIDVDKLDYMSRDSYFTGVSYGFSEVNYILENMYVKNKKIIITPKAISSVEDLITKRVNLFKTVYFHKFSVEYEFLLVKIFERVRYVINNNLDNDIYVNNHIKAFFDGTNTLNDLLSLNDVIVLSEIYLWSESSDDILSDLCSRFINRDKFRIIDLSHKKINITKLKKQVALKYDVDYYFGERNLSFEIIQTPIFVEFEDGLKDLSKVSELVNFYKNKNKNSSFVIFPRDIDY